VFKEGYWDEVFTTGLFLVILSPISDIILPEWDKCINTAID